MSDSDFERLRPLCVALTKDASVERLKELKQCLSRCNPTNLQTLQEYVLFPLRLLLKKGPNRYQYNLYSNIVCPYQPHLQNNGVLICSDSKLTWIVLAVDINSIFIYRKQWNMNTMWNKWHVLFHIFYIFFTAPIISSVQSSNR